MQAMAIRLNMRWGGGFATCTGCMIYVVRKIIQMKAIKLVGNAKLTAANTVQTGYAELSSKMI
jgi:hypothetical protein